MKQSLASAIRRRMKQERLNITAFAKKTKTGRNSIRRILDGKNTSITLKSIGKTAEALNLDFKLTAKKLSPSQIGAIADRMDTADSKGKAQLVEDLVAGFYGTPVKQAHAKDPKV